MKTIKYKLADGHSVDIEVSDEIADVYEQILTYEKKVHRKETRRHVSLDFLKESGCDLPDKQTDIESTIEREAKYAAEMRRDEAEERAKERRLNKHRAELNRKLTPRQAQAYFEFTYLGLKKVEIAKNMNVTEGAVRKLILKAEDNLDKLHAKEIEAKKLAQDSVLQSARKKATDKIPLTKEENEALNLCLLQALFGKN
ncbi:MAG: hypothetical protein KH436_05805 [Firmicutes bacterium]|nr:hypothetical protein [Bacillota bacterium]